MEEGDIPRAGDHYAGVGDAVGIHGSDKLSELVTLVPIGTLVLIED